MEAIETCNALINKLPYCLTANRILAECLTGIAMRRKGITDPKYLSPLTTEHGHDQ